MLDYISDECLLKSYYFTPPFAKLAAFANLSFSNSKLVRLPKLLNDGEKVLRILGFGAYLTFTTGIKL